MGFLERKPDNGEILDRLRAAGKLPEQLNWKTVEGQRARRLPALDTQSDLWHLPNGQTLRVFATARPQGGATWVFENLTEKVDLETRYNTLVQVQGETIDHLSEGVAVFGPDGRITPLQPGLPRALGHHRDRGQARHAYPRHRAGLRAVLRPAGWLEAVFAHHHQLRRRAAVVARAFWSCAPG